jgi:hypothetical protein
MFLSLKKYFKKSKKIEQKFDTYISILCAYAMFYEKQYFLCDLYVKKTNK